MSEFWDEMFRKIGSAWSFEAADSAIQASDLFASEKLGKVLIPGIGFGRNAKPFLEKGISVTGIEISETAIQIAKENNLPCRIHHGSVFEMPFDDEIFGGVYCYAVIHLFNQKERRRLLKNCYNQVSVGGLMVFVTVSKGYKKLYESGKSIGKNRIRTDNGLRVFFYDPESIENEFRPFGLIEYAEIEEQVRHLREAEPMNFWMVICRKQ